MPETFDKLHIDIIFNLVSFYSFETNCANLATDLFGPRILY